MTFIILYKKLHNIIPNCIKKTGFAFGYPSFNKGRKSAFGTTFSL